MQYLPGWTVQCINPGCEQRGHWLKVQQLHGENCPCCGTPLSNVPPPLAPSRLRLRPRPLAAHRPRPR